MPTPIYMPKWGLTMESGMVVQWLKQPGDAVAQDEPVLEAQTEKANGEVLAPAAGILGDLRCKPDDELPVGAVLGYIFTPDEWSRGVRTAE